MESDILSLQLSFSDHIFDRGAALLLSKWRTDPNQLLFSDYFEQTWTTDLKYCYEGAAINCQSTNKGLESLNGKIKELYTSRKNCRYQHF